jgi:hypothetical protein
VLLGCALKQKLVPLGHVSSLNCVCVGGGVWVWRVRERGRGVSRSVFTREGWVVACSIHAYTHRDLCKWPCLLLGCSGVFVLTLPVLRVVVVVVVGGGVAP